MLFSCLFKLMLFIIILDETSSKRAPKPRQFLSAWPKVIGGRKVLGIKYPFFARVITHTDDKKRFCAGTIISNIEVLTAAHCLNYLPDFIDAKQIDVRTGDFTYSTKDEKEHMQKHEVLYYVYYSAYDPFVHTDGYDYALLVLTEKIIFDTYRSSIPVCTGEQGRSNPNNYTVMVVGLGKIEGGKRPKAWMEAELTEVSEDVCRKEFKLPDTHPRGEIVCSGYGAQNQCHGDSGGPIVLYDDAKESSVCLYAIPSYQVAENCSDPKGGTIASRAQYYYDNELLPKKIMFNIDYFPTTQTGTSATTTPTTTTSVTTSKTKFHFTTTIIYPFFATVFTFNDGEHRFCGGTIVNSFEVVTSAHCFNFHGTWIDAKQIDVRTGDFSVDGVDETDRMTEYKVYYYIYCPTFDSRMFADRFDYVILGVSEKIRFDKFTNSIPVCTGEHGRSNPSNFPVTIVGFGKNEDGRNDTYLRETELTEVSEDKCRKEFDIPASHPRGEIFCYGYGVVRTECNGNIGGPIVLYNKEEEKSMCLYAIVSYSHLRNCSDPNEASIATRAQYYQFKGLIRKDIMYNTDLVQTPEVTTSTSKIRISSTPTEEKFGTSKNFTEGNFELCSFMLCVFVVFLRCFRKDEIGR